MFDSAMTPADRPEKAGGRVVLWVLAGLVLLAGGLYAAAYAVAGDNVPRGTTVSGVAIGGHPQAEAAERLERGLAERLAGPVEVTVDGKRTSVDPDRAGLAVDYDASVSDAGGGRSWDPRRLWDHFTGGDEREAVVTVDEERLAATVDRLNREHGREPRDGDVGFRGARVTTVEPRTGRQLDRDVVRETLATAWLDADDAPAELTTVDVAPDIDRDDVAQARDDFANPAVAAPVTLSFAGSDIRLEPAAYTPALSLDPVDGALEPALDDQQLRDLVRSRISTTGDPVDASFRVVDGEPQVVPAKPGVTYDPDQVRDAFLDLVTRPSDNRTLRLDAKVDKPDLTTKEARALGIEEQVSEFTTYYPHAEYRNVNLGRAAELIDGTVLEPGEVFSLNGIVGERTEANGFTEGFIIADGVYKEELGGGVSQMATTVFNAMYFAGLEDVEHRPHSFYIDRYPVGREATVVWGALDLRFRNDTEHGVLVDATVSPSTPGSSGAVTVRMYSTKVWDITSTTSDRYALTEPETRVIRDEECFPHEGYGGFDIDVTRIFRRPGDSDVHHREVFHTTYVPSDSVVCKPPKD